MTDKNMLRVRADGRDCNQLRPLSLVYDFFEHADGSVLYTIGKTKIICSVTLQSGVPSFLRGKNKGWLTAEYAMLPASTPSRTQRDSSCVKRNGRSVEISRMIGRCLRSIINLDLLGERTIFVDCDVLNADGGTRTASITAAYLALAQAAQRWLHKGYVSKQILLHELAAISVGVLSNNIFLDIDYAEDCSIDGDFNFVLTRSGDLVEIQGIAEQGPISWQQFEDMRSLAWQGVQSIFDYAQSVTNDNRNDGFSLLDRLGKNITL